MAETDSSLVPWPDGTVLFWTFENGSFWGQVATSHLEEEEGEEEEKMSYTTVWSDGDRLQFSAKAVDAMQAKAAHTIESIPDHYLAGTPVQRYFDEEFGNGGWWTGKIKGHDETHNYTLEWSDGSLEMWNALNTVAMVHDAALNFVGFKNGTGTPLNNHDVVVVEDEDEDDDDDENQDDDDEDLLSPVVHQPQHSMEQKDTTALENGYPPRAEAPSSDRSSQSVLYDSSDEIIGLEDFPQTEQGIADFLKALDGDPSQTNGTIQEHQQAVYHATQVTIDSASKKFFPIPIEFANSIVEWVVHLDANDVLFSIRYATVVDYEQEFLVEPHYMSASEEGEEALVTERGQFLVGDNENSDNGDNTPTIRFPTTLIVEFDNTYSWFTGKTISYTFKVSPPSARERTSRVESALSLVMQALEQAQEQVVLQTSAAEIASSQVSKTLERYRAVDEEVSYRQRLSQEAQQNAKEAKRRKAHAETKLREQRRLIDENDTTIETIERRIKELQQERLERLQQTESLHKSLPAIEGEYRQLGTQYEIAQKESERLNLSVCDLQIEILNRDQAIADVEKVRDKATWKQKKAQLRTEFLQHLEEELRRRL